MCRGVGSRPVSGGKEMSMEHVVIHTDCGDDWFFDRFIELVERQTVALEKIAGSALP